MINCRKPLVVLDCHTPVIKITVDTIPCSEVKLILTPHVCDEYENVPLPEKPDCSCPIKTLAKRYYQRLKPKPTLTYPLLEVNCENQLVFRLDNKINELKTDRLLATLHIGEQQQVFEVVYNCTSNIQEINTQGELCINPC